MIKDDERLREKLETLDGSRARGAMRRAAVRIEDIEALLDLPDSLKAKKAASDPPSKAEFDALVEDVRTVFNRLTALREALQDRILP